MMKYVFILVLLLVAGAGGLMAVVVGYRFVHNMTQTVRIMPGEQVFPMPAGVVPRGGDLVIPREQREVATRVPNPVRASEASVAIGRGHFQTFCTPCHGAEGKGGVTGPVATRFIPAPDLTSEAEPSFPPHGGGQQRGHRAWFALIERHVQQSQRSAGSTPRLNAEPTALHRKLP